MSIVGTISPDKATGNLHAVYERLKGERGSLAAIHQAQSLNLEVLDSHMKLYMATMFRDSPLSRAQREMLAVVVSSTNGCSYCVAHHSSALLHHWQDRARVEALTRSFTAMGLSDVDRALCALAERLTRSPANPIIDLVDQLRVFKVCDRSVVDTVGVIAYFNYVNRVVLGLGVEIESSGGDEYIYD